MIPAKSERRSNVRLFIHIRTFKQFFICFGDTPHLDGQYTVWGEVIEGMEFVDSIKKGDPQSGLSDEPDKIIKMWKSIQSN